MARRTDRVSIRSTSLTVLVILSAATFTVYTLFLQFSGGQYSVLLGGIAWITDRNYGHRLISHWDFTVRSRLIDSKARHLMGNKAKRRGLEDEIFCCHARIMERVAIRRAILELQFRDREQQHRCMMRPLLIAFEQTVK